MTLKEKIISEFNTNLTQAEIGLKYKCKASTVSKYWSEVFSEEERSLRKRQRYTESKLGDKNPMKGKHKEKHHLYKGIIDDGKGYLIVLKPDWFIGRTGSKHIFYHQLVFCEAAGLTSIPKGFCIHHIDNDPLNNKISNLTLLSNAAHMKLHKYQRDINK